MRKEYGFSKAKANPYAKQLRKSITMQVSVEAIDYFKELATKTGVPYQNLINLYLTQCAHERKVPEFV